MLDFLCLVPLIFPTGLDSGVADNSGVRLFYTSQPREFEAGILELGDPSVELYGSPVGQGLTEHEFTCPGSCSTFFLEDNRIY